MPIDVEFYGAPARPCPQRAFNRHLSSTIGSRCNVAVAHPCAGIQLNRIGPRELAAYGALLGSAAGRLITTNPDPSEVLYQPLGRDRGQEPVRVVAALPAVKAKRVGQGVASSLGVAGRRLGSPGIRGG